MIDLRQCTENLLAELRTQDDPVTFVAQFLHEVWADGRNTGRADVLTEPEPEPDEPDVIAQIQAHMQAPPVAQRPDSVAQRPLPTGPQAMPPEPIPEPEPAAPAHAVLEVNVGQEAIMDALDALDGAKAPSGSAIRSTPVELRAEKAQARYMNELGAGRDPSVERENEALRQQLARLEAASTIKESLGA